MVKYQRAIPAFLILLASAIGVSGCYYRSTERVASTPPAVVTQPQQRVYTYPEGRYELHGDGTTDHPYYWVWIPSGATTVPQPPLPPIPRS